MLFRIPNSIFIQVNVTTKFYLPLLARKITSDIITAVNTNERLAGGDKPYCSKDLNICFYHAQDYFYDKSILRIALIVYTGLEIGVSSALHNVY